MRAINALSCICIKPPSNRTCRVKVIKWHKNSQESASLNLKQGKKKIKILRILLLRKKPYSDRYVRTWAFETSEFMFGCIYDYIGKYFV